MNIFNTPQPTTSAQQEAINLSEKGRITLDVTIAGLKDSFNCFWNNPNATPQEICNEYGTNAKNIFIAYKVMVDAVKVLDPEWEAPVSPKEFTVNQDGSVTISE